MDLYLVRHGVAFDGDPTRWPLDRDRPLTPEGEQRFRQAARGLASLVGHVEVMLSSSYVRAWQTAEVLEKTAGWPKPVACEALEAGREPAAVLQALEPYTASTSIALVGHEPSMHELVSYLLTADTAQAQVEFRKGGVARLELADGPRPGTAILRWLLAPRILRAIGN
jgi:phosphohistidine phosphatase